MRLFTENDVLVKNNQKIILKRLIGSGIWECDFYFKGWFFWKFRETTSLYVKALYDDGFELLPIKRKR